MCLKAPVSHNTEQGSLFQASESYLVPWYTAQDVYIHPNGTERMLRMRWVPFLCEQTDTCRPGPQERVFSPDVDGKNVTWQQLICNGSCGLKTCQDF